MHADNLVVNDGTARQTVKGIAKLLPHLDRESATAFVIKAINAINSGALVVSAQEKKVFRVLDLVGKQEADNFE